MIVGPPHCIHCSRAIYPTAGGWQHGNGNRYCYTRGGAMVFAEPPPNAAANPGAELEPVAE